jgi:hypothetical protein
MRSPVILMYIDNRYLKILIRILKAWTPRRYPHSQDLLVPHQPEDMVEPAVQGTEPETLGL